MFGFNGEGEFNQFTFLSAAHLIALGILLIIITGLFLLKGRNLNSKRAVRGERIFAFTLLIMEMLYHVWLSNTGQWHLSHSLPLELCSISIILTILLLWTGNSYLYQFVLFAGIGGAIQAILTPVMSWGFPHFRYFHFFYTHIGIIVTPLYFTWIKGYRPTLRGIGGTMLALNMLLPIVWIINNRLEGNYMFLQQKPSSGSLLDFLGPYPWYIVSMELMALGLFFFIWLLLRPGVLNNKKHEGE